jgi:5-methyltetrahydropteroyltriglutamate--homocysteine methyltransferase
MRRSTDRIRTTHVGALQRPAALSKALAERGQWAPEVLPELRAGVADVVRRQVATGIDVVDDGEFGKTMWTQYVLDRLDGVGSRAPSAADVPRMKGRDREQFPEFYRWADANASLFGYMEDSYFFSPLARQPVVTGPVTYRAEAVERDIANLRAALADEPDREAFLPVVAPASLEVGLADEHYGNRDDLVRALADALAQEYRAIIEAGFLLQVDDAWVPASWDRNPEYDLESYRRYAATSIEVLNHALAGLPADRIRYHLCWGSWHGPHRNDVPLKDIADIMLRVNAGAYLIEAANSRHEHEYHLWEDVKLPEGKILIPGVVTHATNAIEHPELVAERITRYADRLGAENIIAGADCGFGSRIHPELGWAKLAALVEGAALASARLWALPAGPAALGEEGGDGSGVGQLGQRHRRPERGVPERVAGRRAGDAHVGVGLLDEAVAGRHPEVGVLRPDRHVEVLRPQHRRLGRSERDQRVVAAGEPAQNHVGLTGVESQRLVEVDLGPVGVGALGAARRHPELGPDGARGTAVDRDRRSPGADDPGADHPQLRCQDGREPARHHPQPQLAGGPVLRAGQHQLGHRVQAAPGDRKLLVAHGVVLSGCGAAARQGRLV